MLKKKKYFLILFIFISIFSFKQIFQNKNINIQTQNNFVTKQYDTNTNIVIGMEKLETNMLPSTEKNRLNNSGDWLLDNRGLALLPLIKNNKFDITPALIQDSVYNITFGGLKNQVYSILFNSNLFLNNSFVPFNLRGDINLYLYSDTTGLLVKSSINPENFDERITFNCKKDGNYTLSAKHESISSTKILASGSVRIIIDYQSNKIQTVYFEGKNVLNTSTIFSKWFCYSNSIIKSTYVNLPNSINLFQMGYYPDINSDTEYLIKESTMYGEDLEIQNWDSYYLANLFKLESQNGSGFVTIFSTSNSKGIIEINNFQESYKRYNILNLELKILVPTYYNDINSISSVYIKDPIGNIKFFNESLFLNDLNKFFNYNISYTPYHNGDYTIGINYEEKLVPLKQFKVLEIADNEPIIKNVGYYGPTEFDNYPIFTEVINTGHQVNKVVFRYSIDGGIIFNEKEMNCLEDNYYGTWLHSANMNNIQWEIIIERNEYLFPRQNDAGTGDDASDIFDEATLISYGNYTGKCCQIENDSIDIYKFYMESEKNYKFWFKSNGYYYINIISEYSDLTISFGIYYKETEVYFSSNLSSYVKISIEYIIGTEDYYFSIYNEENSLTFSMKNNLLVTFEFISLIIIFSYIFRKRKNLLKKTKHYLH